MTDKKKFCCEYCYSPIGFVDLGKLADPMTPDMFSSIAPANGVPDPFHPSLEWKDFKCPYCRLRPFVTPGWITITDDRQNRTRLDVGKIDIENKVRAANQSEIDKAFDMPAEPKGTKFPCPTCGKKYAHQSSLARHKKDCNG